MASILVVSPTYTQTVPASVRKATKAAGIGKNVPAALMLRDIYHWTAAESAASCQYAMYTRQGRRLVNGILKGYFTADQVADMRRQVAYWLATRLSGSGVRLRTLRWWHDGPCATSCSRVVPHRL